MSALDELLKDIPQDYDEVDVANHLLHWREPSAAELLALRVELADAKARAKTAEENWHKNEARIAKIETTAKELINVLTDGEIEIARESWGNTNTRLVSECRRALEAALKSQ